LVYERGGRNEKGGNRTEHVGGRRYMEERENWRRNNEDWRRYRGGGVSREHWRRDWR
jgi:hypothetical protein